MQPFLHCVACYPLVLVLSRYAEPLCADAYPLCTDANTLRMQAAYELKASAPASLRYHFIAAALVVRGLESTLF